MGTLLRALTYFLFVLVIGVFTLGLVLFQKKEMLKGRTQKMENAVVALGATIEAERPAVATKPEYPARDKDDCTAQPNDKPNVSDFWSSYSPQLELSDIPKLDINARRDELKSYYKLDETGKPAKDPAGRMTTAGAGTTEAVLKDVLQKSKEQLEGMRATRQQLVKIREETVETITELNQRKTQLRESLNTIVQRDRTVAQLEDRIRGLEAKIAELKDLIRSLEDTIKDQKTQIAEKIKEIEDTEHQIKVLVAEIDIRTRGGTTAVPELHRIPQGYKGVVKSVNTQWNFVVFQLTDEFLSELTAEPNKPLPNLELTVKRKNGDNYAFVTKIHLNHIRAEERVGVADVLTNWQQMPIKEGDSIFL